MKLIFIGFGEAGYNIAAGLTEAGLKDIGAFDANANDPKKGGLIQTRAKELGVKLFATVEEACKDCDFVFSLTSAKVAVAVAKNALPFMHKGQVYIDMNSAAPTVEEEIDKLPRPEGVMFCDAGVMGTVPGNRHKVPMFLSGDGAETFAKAFTQFGMKLTVLKTPAGSSSAIKMFKSVVMKGLPQLMFESFEAASKYGVLDILIGSLKGSLEGKSIEKLADTFIARTLIHSARRSAEMQDVVKTLEILQVDASMSKATVGKLNTMAAKDWATLLGEGGSKLKYKEAMDKYLQLK